MAATAGMSFDDYQTALALVNTDISASNWGGAFIALSKAQVILAGMPEQMITGAQTTRFRMIKDLDAIRAAITQAQIASQTGGAGLGIGLLSITRAR